MESVEALDQNEWVAGCAVIKVIGWECAAFTAMNFKPVGSDRHLGS